MEITQHRHNPPSFFNLIVFKTINNLLICAMIGLLPSCSMIPGYSNQNKNATLIKGPPMGEIVTPVDRALGCLAGHIKGSYTFSVGAIVDLTGKEQFTDGGSGKFVTQGAGDIVQSALYRAGASIVNRRDPRIMESEVKWGLQDIKNIVPSNFFITGSINTLDFIPGGGVDLSVGGVGPTYSQNRILVGLDLSLTETRSGLVISNASMYKQIYADDINFGIGRFVGKTLVTGNTGIKEREALQFSLRQMLNLATLELLTQTMSPNTYETCMQEVSKLTESVEPNEITKIQKGNQQKNLYRKQPPKASSGSVDIKNLNDSANESKPALNDSFNKMESGGDIDEQKLRTMLLK